MKVSILHKEVKLAWTGYFEDLQLYDGVVPNFPSNRYC